MKSAILFSFFSLVICVLSWADTPEESTVATRSVVVKNDTAANTLRLFHTNIKHDSSSNISGYYLNLKDLISGENTIDFSNVYELSLYVQSSHELAITFEFYDAQGKLLNESASNVTVNATAGMYNSYPLVININPADIKQIAGIKLTVSSTSAQANYLIDELVFSYFEEDKPDLGKLAIKKEELQDKYEDYLDTKRQEGYDHERQIEASKNNR